MEVVIFGGGAAGLWLLDELRRRGRRAVLLEANALGTGQTVAAQGIIHGGLKYTLSGLLTNSATSIREMPAIWRKCLDGEREPNLRNVRRRSDECYLWRTDSLSSRLGMIGAQLGLRVAPQSVSDDDRPEILQCCPGTVARLPEQVISTISLIEVLAARNRERLLKIDPARIAFECHSPGRVASIRLGQANGDHLELHPRIVIFTAGAGNSALRRGIGLTAEAMQRRPLHMVLLRGRHLPAFQGHCVDGAKTRVTITSDLDSAGRTVWQVGGQIAEEGVAWDARTLLAKAREELQTVLPGIDLAAVKWSTYRVDRAEGIVPGGKRPESVQIRHDGNCLTAWPTKLALVPQLVTEIVKAISRLDRVVLEELDSNDSSNPSAGFRASRSWESLPSSWPRPEVALPPWETAAHWFKNEDLATSTLPASLPKAA
jgi:glycine/D-amino acid oxidase-like deaminating enzyme